jgi:hypothetical protein
MFTGIVSKSKSAASALIGSGQRTFLDELPVITRDVLVDGLIEFIARAVVPTLQARPV